MIDLKAARNDPDAYRAAVARKGAADTFDELLEADERWRALVPRIDELRGRTKLKGKPSPEQLAEMQQVKEELRAAEEELASPGGSAASTWSAPRGSRALASATWSATLLCSRSLSPAPRSTICTATASRP